MPTSMKKVEVYCESGSADKVTSLLDKWGIYWYRSPIESRGKKTCKLSFYAPIYVIDDIIGELRTILDLRKKENLILVIDVEAGLGSPYRVTQRKWRYRLKQYVSAPKFMLEEETMEKAKLQPAQPLLSMIAGLTALIGLLLNNPYIIIGSMLISPILGPLYSLSLGIYWKNKKLAYTGAKSTAILIASPLIASLTALALIAIMGGELRETPELLMRTRVTSYDVVLPILLGVAGAFSIATTITEALTGVAVAAAIIPPTATLAWTITTGSVELILGSAELLSLNILGLVAGGIMGQVILGLLASRNNGEGRDRGKSLNPKQASKP